MERESKVLLEGVAVTRLQQLDDIDPASTEAKEVFKQAMEAVDRTIEYTKLEDQRYEQEEKRKQEAKEALAKRKQDELEAAKRRKQDLILKCVEIGAMCVVVPVVDVICKGKFVKMVGAFEQTDFFRTTAGKSLGQLFKFKK